MKPRPPPAALLPWLPAVATAKPSSTSPALLGEDPATDVAEQVLRAKPTTRLGYQLEVHRLPEQTR
ncbi:hypothetical protein [Duganella sp. BJB1802]|uniref:hypothetical protein n=1 Tax=Duganella sp. BJB1802 TaxID=2744575 RepID=UPI001E3115E5|nr:hypothetical protein [Duganella sp. BJB1802]